MKPDEERFDKFNMNHIIIKPLYFGLTANVVLPGALLFICYYLDTNRHWTEGLVSFETANTLFPVFAVLALINYGAALWMKNKLAGMPMIRRKETFEDDLANSLLEKTKPIFILISLAAVYGVLYYFLTTRFREAAFFCHYFFCCFPVRQTEDRVC